MSEERETERAIGTLLEEAGAFEVSDVVRCVNAQRNQVRRVTFRMLNCKKYSLEGVRADGEKAMEALYYEASAFVRAYRLLAEKEVT